MVRSKGDSVFTVNGNGGFIGWADMVDLYQIPQNAWLDHGLHCLPFIQQFLDTSTGNKVDFFL